MQQGKPVVDIAVYTGEEIPRRAYTPDKLVPMLPGLFGPERVASERERLANDGLPMVESPVGVRHSAGILDLKDWINPLHGYQYDSMNKDALLTRPFNYRVLVIPQGVQVSSEVQARIEELRQRGVQIIDSPYQENRIKGLAPDIILPEGIAYSHRRGDGFDLYFLSNQTAQVQHFSPTFRHKNTKAVLYNPLKDESLVFDGTVTLPPYGSMFICMGRDICTQSGKQTTPPWENTIPMQKAIDQPWDITFRESGLQLKNQPLFDWSQHEDHQIRYFSGHARYTTTWKLKAKEVPTGRAWLSLPNVKDIAHVWINGKDCGIAWTIPYEVEITGAQKKEKNKIEIEVVNRPRQSSL